MRSIAEPDDVEILRAAIKARLADVRTSIPAMIETYDHATQTASVLLAVKLPKADGTPEELKPIADVPVCWPRGGGYFVTMPLAAGDAGLLVFCEADFTTWRETGEVSEPPQERRHGLYCYFIPGGCKDGAELVDAEADALVIGKQGGNVIKISGTDIQIGASAANFVALANKVDANFQAIVTMFSGWTPVVQDGGAALKAAAASLSFDPVAAAKVKAE